MFDTEIKVIAFDLDNTLYDQDEYYLQVIRFFAKNKGIGDQELINAFNRVKNFSRDIFGDILKEAGLYSPSHQERLFNIYKSIDAKIDIFASAREVLTMLIEQGIKRAIITNGVIDVQKNKIKCLGIESLFNLIIYAREWGKDFEKPHNRPFRFLINYFQCRPEEVLFLGDKNEIDIMGAANAGMKCELVEANCDFIQILNKYKKI